MEALFEYAAQRTSVLEDGRRLSSSASGARVLLGGLEALERWHR